MISFDAVVDICGIAGLAVSLIGTIMSYRAYSAAKNTKDTVNKKLFSYRLRVNLSEKNNSLKGARDSIATDGLMVNAALASSIRSTARSLLISGQLNLHTSTLTALKTVVACTSPFLSAEHLNDQEAKEKTISLLDALDDATNLIDEEDFRYEQQD